MSGRSGAASLTGYLVSGRAIPPSGEPTIEIFHVVMPDHELRYRYELTYEFTDVLDRRWRHARGHGLTLLSRHVPMVEDGAISSPRTV